MVDGAPLDARHARLLLMTPPVTAVVAPEAFEWIRAAGLVLYVPVFGVLLMALHGELQRVPRDDRMLWVVAATALLLMVTWIAHQPVVGLLVGLVAAIAYDYVRRWRRGAALSERLDRSSMVLTGRVHVASCIAVPLKWAPRGARTPRCARSRRSCCVPTRVAAVHDAARLHQGTSNGVPHDEDFGRDLRMAAPR